KKENREKLESEILANLIFNLLPKCQQKELWLAEKNGILHAELKCLRLFETNDKLNNRFIANSLKMSQSRSTRIIDGLVNKGFLNREENPADRRNVEVSLLRKGKILTNKLRKDYINLHHKILDEIDTSQHGSLILAMENLNSAIEIWLQKPRLSYLSKKISLEKAGQIGGVSNYNLNNYQ
ncbi:MAG: MarR family transcriptional regulator, partial [Ignavibacteriaceae bacterium]